jgi:fatty-acyl-CoA synthase
MTDWNVGRIWKAVAEKIPNQPAQIYGGKEHSWNEFHRRANALAADLQSAGLSRHSKVSCYLYNGPEYLETMFGSFLASCVPINTNYRYGPEEIVYLFDNADAEAVVFHGAFAELVDGIRSRLPKVKRWYMVKDEVTTVPSWASDYESIVSVDVADVDSSGMSGDDMLFLYTGGTTGMPKGVMWRLDDLINVLGAGGNLLNGFGPAEDMDELLGRIDPNAVGVRTLVACPLMHGTGQFSAIGTLINGGCIVTLPNRSFDVELIWDTVQKHKVNNIIIVGQAFAGPMLEALDANPGKYDLSSVKLMTSSGVMWGQENKDGLIGHMPQVILFDSYGSSEAVGLGASVSAKGALQKTAKFMLGPNCAVFTEDGRRVEPGSTEQGMVAVGGFIPLGYYKDEVKSKATFREYEGRRWSIPGDFATVDEDNTIHLLGRGSVCINTGGEKVFPEEVEEAMKTHPGVRDAVAVGVPDDRFGEAICAVVEAEGTAPSLDDIAGHVRAALAAYKAPRHMVVVDTIGRAPNGKVDYKRLKEYAVTTLGKSR